MELGDWGALDLGLAATYVDEYAYDLGIGAPGVGDGVGQQNDTIQEIPPTGGMALPRPGELELQQLERVARSPLV